MCEMEVPRIYTKTSSNYKFYFPAWSDAEYILSKKETIKKAARALLLREEDWVDLTKKIQYRF